MNGAFHLLKSVSEHIWEGRQVWPGRDFGRFHERNSGTSETVAGTQKLHIINNGSTHLCTKNAAIGHSCSRLGGWVLWGLACLVKYFLILCNNRLRKASRLRLDSYGVLSVSQLFLVTVFFVLKKCSFHIWLQFHSYDVCTLRVYGI